MSDITTTATLELEVPDPQLRQVRQTIESEIGATQVGVTDGGTASAQAARQGAGGARAQRRARMQHRWARERNEHLATIVEQLDDMEGMGGGGGGGGGGLGIPSLGAGYLLGGGGGGGMASRLLMGGGLAGPIAMGGLLGIGGTRLLQEMGVMEGIRESGQDFREDTPGGEIIGDASQFLPVELGTVSLDLAQGDLSFSRTAELYSNRVDVLGNLQRGETEVDPTGQSTKAPNADKYGNSSIFEEQADNVSDRDTSEIEDPLSQQTPFEILEQIESGDVNAGDIARLATRGSFSDEQMSPFWNQVDVAPGPPDDMSSFTNPDPTPSSTRSRVAGPGSDTHPMVRRGSASEATQQSSSSTQPQNVTYEQTAEAEANIDVTIDASIDDLEREVENANQETKRELETLRRRFDRLKNNIERAG